MDILTMEQLEVQRERREGYLKMLRESGAPEKTIRTVMKDLELTNRRIERLKENERSKIEGN